MSERTAHVTKVSPVLRYVVWLCDHGHDFDEALRIAEDVSYTDDSGILQFKPECIATLPGEVLSRRHPNTEQGTQA